MRTAAEGDRVRVRLEGRSEDGSVFEKTPEGTTQEAVLGTNTLLPAIELAAVGMKAGESKALRVPPDQAFGARLDQLVFRLPRTQIPDEAKVGDSLKVKFQGQEGLVIVVSFEDDVAILDANHPLAGQTLGLRVELVEIVDE